MAYISPFSDVYILKHISLDDNYNHTVLQTDRVSQFNMFNNSQYVKYRLNNQSYQRVGNNKIRVALLADDLYDCNYMMFRNTAFGDKWFYAFITGVNYINNSTTEITYKIDEMQTWYFDYEIPECYVEREHTQTDEVGDNLVPENLPELQLIPQQTFTRKLVPNDNESSIKYVFLIYYVPKDKLVKVHRSSINGLPLVDVENISDNTATGFFVNGVFMPCYMVSWEIDFGNQSQENVNISKIIYYLQQYNCTIVKIDQMPYRLYTGTYAQGLGNSWDIYTYSPARYNKSGDGRKSYIPRNKKLQTYPFRSLTVSNCSGQTMDLRWEWFTNGNARLKFLKIAGPTMEFVCTPMGYRNLTEDVDNSLIYDDFVQPAWNENTFLQWWAQNKESFVLSLVSSAILTAGMANATIKMGSFVEGAPSVIKDKAMKEPPIRVRDQLYENRLGHPFEGATMKDFYGASAIAGYGAKSIAGSLADYASHKNAPNQISSQAMCSALKVVQNKEGFIIYDMGLEYSCAKAVDNYFSMFGYAVKEIKKPNVQNPQARLRPHWNYIQTVNCIIHPKPNSGLNSDNESTISAIYDKGITFWKNLNEIGDYNLDNSPAL